MIAALAALGDDSPDIMEVFSPGRFTEMSSAFDLRPGLALDLRTGWNLSEPAVVAKAWAAWKESEPTFLMLSPMCKAFSTLQNLTKGSEKHHATLREGMDHMNLSMKLAKAQHEAGRYFLFEHPWSAWSWKLEAVREVMDLNGGSGRGGPPVRLQPEVGGSRRC
jgi:hypothetical protein